MAAVDAKDRVVAPPLAELHGVAKRFGNVVALHGLDLTVRPGEVLSVLGPNGAGKSTAVRIMLGLLTPDAGCALLLGRPPHELEVRRQIGVMLQSVALTPELRARELIELATLYYPRPMGVDEALASSGATAIANRPYGKLSFGQQRLVQFAVAICGRPRLLFLDEPTAGLDVEVRELVWRTLRMLVAEGASIVLTTHHLEEAESVSDRVAVLVEGRLVAQGTVAHLRNLAGGKHVSCATRTDADTVRAWPDVAAVSRDSRGLRVRTRRAEAVVRQLLDADHDLSDLEVRPAALVDVFRELTRETAT